MNESERRFLDLVQTHLDVRRAAREVAAKPIVRYFNYSAMLGEAGTPFVVGAINTGVIPIQADSTFVLQALSCAMIIPGGVVAGDPPLPNYVAIAAQALLQITDTGSGEVIYSGAVSAPLAAGGVLTANVGIPFVFPTPRVIPPNTNVRIEMTYLGALTPDLFSLTLMGARVEQI